MENRPHVTHAILVCKNLEGEAAASRCGWGLRAASTCVILWSKHHSLLDPMVRFRHWAYSYTIAKCSGSNNIPFNRGRTSFKCLMSFVEGESLATYWVCFLASTDTVSSSHRATSWASSLVSCLLCYTPHILHGIRGQLGKRPQCSGLVPTQRFWQVEISIEKWKEWRSRFQFASEETALHMLVQ